MDLGTTGIIVGIIAAVVYLLETACKYGSLFLKNRSERPPANSKKILTKRSRPLSPRGTSFAAPSFIKGSYSHSTRVQPGYDIDILTCHHGSSGLLKKI
jgi:hypothetical protein